jgi:D-alanine-D-alanine ligase
MVKKTLAIIFGAQSYEHEISIVSAITMKKVLDQNLVYIFIDKDRNFFEIPTDRINSKIFSSGEYKKCDKLMLQKGGFFKKTLFGSKKVEFDCALNLVHGGDGEDGVLASLFKFFEISFIGPRLEACSVSFSKYFTKMYAKECGVKTLDYQFFNKGDIINIENFPVIIKPTRLGSSIGISIVRSKEELNYALDIAFEFDSSIIVEPFIEGIKEYNLAGAKICDQSDFNSDKFVFSMVEEPTKGDILDFEKKYLDFNRTSQVLEAQISTELKNKLQENFEKIYNTLFEGSLIRCDFFVLNDEVYINEINPIPGSMSNYLFDDFGNVIIALSENLPKVTDIVINYEYVNTIQQAKGKA